MPITPFGRFWEWRHSLWIAWIFFPFAFLAPIGFLYISIRGRKLRWFYIFLGLLINILFFAFVDINFDTDHFMYDIATFIALVSWVVAIGFAFSARREYLQILAKRRLGEETYNQFLEEVRSQTLYSMIPEAQRPIQQTKDSHESVATDKVQPVQINKTTVEALRRLPGVDSITANRIIEERENIGEFKSFNQLVEQLNIQPHILAKARRYIAFSDSEYIRLEENLTGGGVKKSKRREETSSKTKRPKSDVIKRPKGKQEDEQQHKRGRIVDY